MLTFPLINPVLFSMGPLQIRWYGLMYAVGFAVAYYLVFYQIRRFSWQELLAQLDNLNMLLIIGVVLGGRLGYVLLYNPDYYLANPTLIPAIWQGGMSFHGGCLGAILAGGWFCRKHRLNFWRAADLFVVAAPLGLFFGRIGNFINGELYGRVTASPLGMLFPGGGPLPRHPSQLYEALGEGLLLFVLLWALKARPWQRPLLPAWPHGSMLAFFLIGYGMVRFFLEFFREPDAQLGLIALSFSMGQVLCLLMIAAGLVLWRWRVIKRAARMPPAATVAGSKRRR